MMSMPHAAPMMLALCATVPDSSFRVCFKQVDFACDGAGNPLFSLSPLAMHTRNILEDPRCTLVVQMPGWQGLSNARVTMFGEIYKLPNDMQEAAREVRHPCVH